MTKKQKIWLLVFLAMFIVPEIIWGNLSGLIRLGPLVNNSQFFEDYPIYLYSILLMEIIGVASLLYLSKYWHFRYEWKKITIRVVLMIILAILLLVLFESYVVININFP